MCNITARPKKEYHCYGCQRQKNSAEDLLEEAILIVYNKIKSYDLDYRDKHGNLKPVRFVSYIWKRTDGFIIDYLKDEMKTYTLYKDIMDLTQTEGN